jgi:hypothetical protein
VRAKRNWKSPIYGFFLSAVETKIVDGKRAHIFHCAAEVCGQPTRVVKRFTEGADRSSTANLRYHAKRCFGDCQVERVEEEHKGDPQAVSKVRAFLAKYGNGKIGQQTLTHLFGAGGKGPVYSFRALSEEQSRSFFFFVD